MSEDGSASEEGRTDALGPARAVLESAINYSVRMDPEALALLAPLRAALTEAHIPSLMVTITLEGLRSRCMTPF